MTPIQSLPERIYVLRDGMLHTIPDGLYLLVPTKPGPFLRSGLFSWPGKLRMLAELFIPAKTNDTDESVADFIRRRLGGEALDRLGEPLLAGVYNADVEQMSIGATFRQFPALEASHGSLIAGMQERMKNRIASEDRPPALVSMKNGMETFATAIADKLTGDIRTGAPVTGIQQQSGGYVLSGVAGDVFAQSVVIGTPTTVSADLLQRVDPDVAAELRQIRYEGVGSMAVAYRAEHIPHPLDAYGVVIPGSEGRRIDGITFASAKWNHRAPEGYHLMRVFFGGPNTRDMLDLDDDRLLGIVRDELQDLLGITEPPLFAHARRWEAGYPQYDVGHAERVETMRKALPDNIFLVGFAYDGVGLPDTIRGARDAVKQLAVKQQKEEVV